MARELKLESTAWRIDRRRLLGLMAASGLVPTGSFAAIAQPQSAKSANAKDLLQSFIQPPHEAGPGAYWYWLGGNVTRDGVTADLEAMRMAGVTRPMLFTIGSADKNTKVSPPAATLSDYWWKLVEHAAAEAGRLDMTLAFNFCDGWATASGPWITPEMSMQHVVWSSHIVEGNSHFRGALTQPESVDDYYRDIAILAHPFPAEWSETSFTRKAKITTDLPLEVSDPAKITDPDNMAEIVNTQAAGAITYAFEEPFVLRSVAVHTPSPPGYSPGVYRAANSLLVESSDDGRSFRTIGRLEYPKHGWQTDLTHLTHALPETRARFFRLVHTPIPPQPYEEEYDFGEDTRLRFYSIVLSSEPRIHHWQGKTGEQWAISRRTTGDDVPDSACIRSEEILDLTGQVSQDGVLDWKAPEGRWRVLRIGYTTTGKTNSAAGGARGLECDRFNPEAAKLQFDNWFNKALQRVGPKLAGKVLHVLHVDSWEAGTQNWSPVFPAEFRKLRKYDLTAFLPVMTGAPVDSADASERVLFDVRRSINELMQEKFFKTVAELAHQHDCVFSAEPANPTFPADGMEHARYVDLPMGEFWLRTPRNDKPTDVKDAVNGARLYGKQIVGAESFTEGLMDWTEQPFTFKALGDHNFCEGVNRLMLHVYAAQPWTDRAPGMTLNGIGSFFSRTQTWWKPGKAWFDYLRRCQALLQSGRAVADVCYFIGENIPSRSLLARQLPTPLPHGYAYDSINRDAILGLARMERGRIVLEGGASYSVLVLPETTLMTPELAEKLGELVRKGAVVIGPRPERSPSFVDWPDADRRLRSVAADLWGDLDGVNLTERRVGRGRVIWGKSLEEVLSGMNLAPDAAISGAAAEHIEWTHRAGRDWDFYFFSNQSDQAVRFEAFLRIQGRKPELWHADSGQIETPGVWEEKDGVTRLPLALDPSGSVFVAFARSSRGADPIVAIEGGGADSLRLREVDGAAEAEITQAGAWTLRRRSGRLSALTLDEIRSPFQLTGPWRVQFSENLTQPVVLNLRDLHSWTEQSDPDIKYYSGAAQYTTEFDYHAPQADERIFLSLGKVCDIASVELNGRELGVLWKPPFSIDITEAVRSGRNSLRVSVTNTWRNRLIGDFGKPASQRKTFVVPMLRKEKPWLPGGADVELSPAGLLGPVQIKSAAIRRID